MLAERGFRLLLATRLLGQLSDGILQAGLASYVLFSPERQATGAAIAASFAVLLLPYSVVGPFAGVLIDRWRRRQILLGANVVRVGDRGHAGALVLHGADERRLHRPGAGRARREPVHPRRPVRRAAARRVPGPAGHGERGVHDQRHGGHGHWARAPGWPLGSGPAAATPRPPGSWSRRRARYLLAAVVATLLRRDELGPDRRRRGPPPPARRPRGRARAGLRRALPVRRPRGPGTRSRRSGSYRVTFGVMTVLVVPRAARCCSTGPRTPTAGCAG